MTPTDEQEEIKREVKESQGHLLVDALAGTGKTSTLVMAASGVKGFALALAFNKKIAEELTKRLPGNFEAKTMNSLGFAALRGALPKVKGWEIDARKVGKIISEQAKERKEGLKGEKWLAILRLVEQAQREGLRPGEGDWGALAEESGVDAEEQEEVIALAREALAESNRQVEQGRISFDDQLYWPIVFQAKVPRFGMIFVDEAQDLNVLQHELVHRSASGRVVVAGDPRQSIYGWRGAVTNSMGALRDGLGSKPWTSLGLTMTWRCPSEVVKRQLGHVPRYRSAEGAPQGRVIRLGGGEGLGWGMRELMELRPHASATMAILCRNNSPLWRLAFRLLRQKVSLVMQGSDLGKLLLTLSRKIEGENSAGIEKFNLKLEAWAERQRSAAKSEYAADAIADKVECLRAVGENSRTAGELRDNIEKLFARTSGTLTLSTIHRAKGLEWDLVGHLDPWRVPGKRALARGGEELEQSLNLQYVAETRTKHTLVLMDLEDFL